MHAMITVLKHVPDNPMVPEWIGIQSRGMKQWVAAQMADNFGICANINFLFPRQMIDQVIYDQSDDQKESLNEDVLLWSIMKLINKSKTVNELSYIQDYIGDDETGKKQYQLSMQIAKIFDDYQVYRPSMLSEWQRHNNHAFLKDSDAKWQAWLWNSILSDNPYNNIAYKISHFLEKFDVKNINKGYLPLRISFFGISAMPKIFLQVFERISQIMDINLFLLTPSNQFFFDIKSDKQMGKISLTKEIPFNLDQLYYEVKNPLLSSLGTAGKDFQSCLESFNYHEPFNDLFSDPLQESCTMLAYLQSDIFNLVYRKHDREDVPVKIESSDNSVSIHACHSPMREAQVLKDLLLNEFKNDSDLAPHDIIVVMPDIEAYAPFIESVFALEDTLPFSISDRKKRPESESIEAFFKILALRNSRLEQNQVLDLLISESIVRKFNISFDEIAMIEKMVNDAAVLWGKDADHRKTFNLPPFEENTWFFGLQRLFMGMAMPENYDRLIREILPCQSFEGLDLEVLGKLALFCNTLFVSLETLPGKKNIEQWCQVLKSICNSLMDRNFQNGEDLTFLLQTIDKIKQDSQEAGFDQSVSFDVISSILENKLDQSISQGRFLTGNIIFCNTMPMRSIPFKIVVLMGMDEKSFPGQVFRPEFDLIKKYPKPCDKIQRDEARNLFLETLLSARSKLIITYNGMSIQDNSKTPCAGVVSEILDTMEHSFIFPESYIYHFFHPLHPFNQEYFIGTRDYFSFSRDNCKIAKALSKKRVGHHTFVQIDAGAQLQKPVSSIMLFEMIIFFKNPVQWYMKERLGIKIPDMDEATTQEQGMAREPFNLSGLDQYSLGSFLLDHNSMQPEVSGESQEFVEKDYYPILKAGGTLPFGKKGKLEYENTSALAQPVIDAAKKVASKTKLPAIAGEVDINSITVLDSITQITRDGAYYLSFGKLNGSRLILAWIKHLFLNLTALDDYPKNTTVIGRDPQGKKELLKYSFLPLESNALQSFKKLVQIYLKGGENVFYFACETSWQLVQILSKESFNLETGILNKAMNHSKVKSSWYGNNFQAGEKDNPYISLCLEHNDPFESVDTLIATGFAQNSVNVYKPMLENMEIIDN